jgi:hypothetical protein
MTETDVEDLETLFGVLDRALTSDNPAVQDALRQLVVTVALATPNQKEKNIDGPLKRLLLMVQHMDGRISALEREKWVKQSQADRPDWSKAKKWQPPKI